MSATKTIIVSAKAHAAIKAWAAINGKSLQDAASEALLSIAKKRAA